MENNEIHIIGSYISGYEKMHYNIGKNGILNLNEKMNNEIKEKFKLIKQKNVGLLKFRPKRIMRPSKRK